MKMGLLRRSVRFHRQSVSLPTTDLSTDPRSLQRLDRNLTDRQKNREWKRKKILSYNENDTIVLFSGKRMNFPNLASNFLKSGNLYADILEAASASYGKFVFSEMIENIGFSEKNILVLLISSPFQALNISIISIINQETDFRALSVINLAMNLCAYRNFYEENPTQFNSVKCALGFGIGEVAALVVSGQKRNCKFPKKNSN